MVLANGREMEFSLDESIEMVALVKERRSTSIHDGCIWMAPPMPSVHQPPHVVIARSYVQPSLTSGPTALVQLGAGLVRPS